MRTSLPGAERVTATAPGIRRMIRAGGSTPAGKSREASSRRTRAERGRSSSAETADFFHVTPPHADWSPEKQEEWLSVFSATTLPAIAVHEVAPGHFSHARAVLRAPSPVRRTVFSEGFIEGWAHYVEELTKLIEAKVQGEEVVTPPAPEEPKVINLMDALKRSVAAAKKGGNGHVATSKQRKAAAHHHNGHRSTIKRRRKSA